MEMCQILSPQDNQQQKLTYSPLCKSNMLFYKMGDGLYTQCSAIIEAMLLISGKVVCLTKEGLWLCAVGDW
jgi:hypothetical protein